MSENAERTSSHTTASRHFRTDDEEQVCRVMPDGEVRCTPQSEIEIPDPYKALVEVLRNFVRRSRDGHGHGGGDDPPDTKLELAVKLVQVVMDSKMLESCVPERRQAVVESVFTLTSVNPPAMLLFRYSRLAADVMAPYLANRGRLAEAVNVIETFRKPLPAC